MDEYLKKEYWNGLIKMSLSKLFILKVLFEESLHGYEISKRIASLTSGCCAPTEGTLYPVLKEFEKYQYLICKIETVKGRKRKTYTITAKGKEAYAIGIAAWQETAQVLVDSHEKLNE